MTGAANPLQEKLAELERELAELRGMKRDALESGGNAWHDNASWDIIVQDEQRLLKSISELKAKLASRE